MLKDLKFVKGAVAKKDLLPAMTHFRIEDGHVRSYNGKLALSSPIAFDINCNPKADKLIHAIEQCDEAIVLSLTPGGKLRIQSGKFRSHVDLIQGETPHVMPEGDIINFDGEKLLDAIRILEPFIGEDASRPWTNGILFHGNSAFATCNVILVEYWLGTPFPFVVNVPRACIHEMLRVDEPPTHGQITQNSITFHYQDQRWIRSQLLEITWPDLSRILDVECNPRPIPDGLFEGIEKLRKSTDGSRRIYFQRGLLRTHIEDDPETGAFYEVDGLDFEGCYNMDMFALLKGVATTADFTLYPKHAIFYGDRIRGAIIGMRQ